MTDKAYIVANGEQEREVLKKLELKGCLWRTKGIKPTEWVPSHIEHLIEFPYVLLGDGTVSWEYMYQLEDEEIVYDGRKESKMKISKEVYDALVEWRRNKNLINDLVWYTDIKSVPEVVKEWWIEDFVDTLQTNNRLIAIIRWVNGEDVFEIEKPNKWIVRSKECTEQGRHLYVGFINRNGIKDVINELNENNATKFDTKEEAESWANAHQEVIEVEA